MTRGRHANADPIAPTDTLNREALAADSAALTELGRRSTEIAERFGDGQAYERGRVVSEARFYMAQSAEAMLELGKRLIQIKENEAHGEFAEIVTERLGIGERSAQRMMKAAVKFLAPALAAKATTLSLLGKAKLFDLMDESDDDLLQLTEGGTVAGLELDEVQAMSARELRTTLKKERAERTKSDKAKQKVIDGKDAKLNEQAEALARRDSIDPSELETFQLDAARNAALEAELAVRYLVGQASTVLEKPASEATELAARQAVEFVAQVFASLLQEAQITVSFEELVTPHWLAGVKDAAQQPKRAKKA